VQALPRNALAAGEFLHLLIRIFQAVAAHYRLHGLAQHFPGVVQVLVQPCRIQLQPAQNWSLDFRDDAVVYTRGDVFKTDNAGSLSYGDLVYKILQTDGPKTREYLEDTITAMKGQSISSVNTARNRCR